MGASFIKVSACYEGMFETGFGHVETWNSLLIERPSISEGSSTKDTSDTGFLKFNPSPPSVAQALIVVVVIDEPSHSLSELSGVVKATSLFLVRDWGNLLAHFLYPKCCNREGTTRLQN